ncbi:hypothetical protein ACNPQM_28755 [Streptomyces sp. NPDC056231]|uniref:hypothetical protein n=1 Tax=Streptomyces sp. NPDC056231 TaxID=3345755 RepID=UPI003AAFA45A
MSTHVLRGAVGLIAGGSSNVRNPEPPRLICADVGKGPEPAVVRSLFACRPAPDGFHQLTDGADFAVGDAERLLHEAGQDEEADLVERKIKDRDVTPGHWTFQIIEAFDRTFWWLVETLHSRPLGAEVSDHECHNG